VLSRGGSADGMTLYTNFRGKEPDKTPMLKARGLWTEPEPAEDEIPAENDETAADDATLRPMPKQNASLEFD
jgi:peptidyl-dipeptidase dcp . metallo peptidase. MEROPS family M03A